MSDMPPVTASPSEDGSSWIGHFGRLGQYPVLLTGTSKENLMQRAEAFWISESAKARVVLGSNREVEKAPAMSHSKALNLFRGTATKAVEKAVAQQSEPRRLGKGHFGGSVWVNKAGSVKRIPGTELGSYEAQGWKRGRR